MNAILLPYLASIGATAADGIVLHFGNPQDELIRVRDDSYIADLSQYGLIEFSGPDAEAFLQNQLSCDVKAVTNAHASLGGYCTPKGRLLASFLLWQRDSSWWMMAHSSLLEGLLRRLRMFVLRSKVTLTDRTADLVLTGIGGPAAADALHRISDRAPDAAYASSVSPSGETIVALPGGRYLIVAEPTQALSLWPEFGKTLQPVGTPAWEWTEVTNGIAFVNASTQDQFIPQMINLELVGGVSFKKGCYPGQEIVARTQHIGQVKRRMYLAHVDEVARPGDPLFGSDVAGQANGLIAAAASAPGGGWDVLAVVQRSSVENATVHLNRAGGPALTFRPLPYALP